MNGRKGALLVAGDYGASDDESDRECVQPLHGCDLTASEKNPPRSSMMGQKTPELNQESEGRPLKKF